MERGSRDAPAFGCQALPDGSCEPALLRGVLCSGPRAAFLTRALLFPLPTAVDHRLSWNMSEKRSEARVKVLEL